MREPRHDRTQALKGAAGHSADVRPDRPLAAGPQDQGPGGATVCASTLADFFDRHLAEVTVGATPATAELWEAQLYAPLRAFLARPGKGLRARLVGHGWALQRGGGAAPELLCMLPEILHAASLIVDDIEDGALRRRGGPALHRQVGVSRALNAANWLYFWPYALLRRLDIDEPRRQRCATEITQTLLRSHLGQSLDLGVQVADVPQAELMALVRAQCELKTGALTGMSAAIGVCAAGGDDARIDAARQAGQQIGLGLQLLDDITGVLVRERREKAFEDLAAGRPTWVWALVAEGCDADEYAALTARYRRLRSTSPAADQRRWLRGLRARLALLVGERGRDRASDILRRVPDDLVSSFGNGPAVEALRADLGELEQAYG